MSIFGISKSEESENFFDDIVTRDSMLKEDVKEEVLENMPKLDEEYLLTLKSERVSDGLEWEKKKADGEIVNILESLEKVIEENAKTGVPQWVLSLQMISQRVKNSSISDLKKNNNYKQLLNQIEKVYRKDQNKHTEKLLLIFTRLSQIFFYINKSNVSLEKIRKKKQKKKRKGSLVSPKKRKKKFSFFRKIRKIFRPQSLKNESRENIMEKHSIVFDRVFCICRICNEKIKISSVSEHLVMCEIQMKLSHKFKKYTENLALTSVKITTQVLVGIRKGAKVSAKEKGVWISLEKITQEGATIKINDHTAKNVFKLVNSLNSIREEIKLMDRITRVLSRYYKRVEKNIQKMSVVVKKCKSFSIKLETFKNGITLESFDMLGLITRGKFGRVFLGQKKESLDIFAIKVLEKNEISKKNQVEDVIKERNIMVSASNSSFVYHWRDNPFIVKTFYSFSQGASSCIVMEYCPGGDLFTLLDREMCLSMEQTRQYIAELVLALESFHDRGIIHRDLKPDNILIDKKGHLKLTDFGLSEIGLKTSDVMLTKRIKKKVEKSRKKKKSFKNFFAFSKPEEVFFPIQNIKNSSTGISGSGTPEEKKKKLERQKVVSGLDEVDVEEIQKRAKKKKIELERVESEKKGRIIGTPDYIAIEALEGKTCSFGVDHWALGVIMFQLLFGYTPFGAQSVEKVFSNILEKKIMWPNEAQKKVYGFDKKEYVFAVDLIKKLLTSNPKKRIGGEKIKKHKWFESVNWNNVLKKKPLFVPEISDDKDMKLFEERHKYFPCLEKNIKEGPVSPLYMSKSMSPKLEREELGFINYHALAQLTKEVASKRINKELEKIKKLKSRQSHLEAKTGPLTI